MFNNIGKTIKKIKIWLTKLRDTLNRLVLQIFNMVDNDEGVKKTKAKRKKLNNYIKKQIKKQDDEEFNRLCDKLASSSKKEQMSDDSDNTIRPTDEYADEWFTIKKMSNNKQTIVINSALIKNHNISSPSGIQQSNIRFDRDKRAHVPIIQSNIGSLSCTVKHVYDNEMEGCNYHYRNPKILTNIKLGADVKIKVYKEIDNVLIYKNTRNQMSFIDIKSYQIINAYDTDRKRKNCGVIFPMMPMDNIKLSGSVVVVNEEVYLVDSCVAINNSKNIVTAYSMEHHNIEFSIIEKRGIGRVVQLSDQPREISKVKTMSVLNYSSAPWEYVKIILHEKYKEMNYDFNQKPLFPSVAQFSNIVYKPLARGFSIIVVDEDDIYSHVKIANARAGMKYKPEVYKIEFSTEQHDTYASRSIIACDHHIDDTIYRGESWQPVDELYNTIIDCTLIYKRLKTNYCAGEAGIRAFCRHKRSRITVDNIDWMPKRTWISLKTKDITSHNYSEYNRNDVFEEPPYYMHKAQYRAGCSDYLQTPNGYISINKLFKNNIERKTTIDYIISALSKATDYISRKVNSIVLWFIHVITLHEI